MINNVNVVCFNIKIATEIKVQIFFLINYNCSLFKLAWLCVSLFYGGKEGGGGVRVSQVFGMFSVFNIFRKVLYTSIHSLSIQRVISKDKARRCFVKLQVLCLILVKFNLIVYLRFKDIRDRNIKWASNTKIDV